MRLQHFVVKHNGANKPLVTNRPLLYLASTLDADSYIRVLKSLPYANGLYSLELQGEHLTIQQLKDFDANKEPREPKAKRPKL